MATRDEDKDEKDKRQSTSDKEESPTKDAQSKKRKNAFSELMAPKPKHVVSPVLNAAAATQAHRGHVRGSFRDGLAPYLSDPASQMVAPGEPVDGRVIYFSDTFVAIHDKFPKASVHCLLLPRDPTRSRQHPVALLSKDAVFRAAVQAEAAKLQHIVAAELRRRFGGESMQDAEREAVLAGDVSLANTKQPPAGRDWASEVKVGVHARPSMNNLHVHVLSRDMHSACLKHRKHYNSFNTPFFVSLDEFPLSEDDPRHPPPDRPWPYHSDHKNKQSNDKQDEETVGSRDGHPGYLRRGMRCWRCHRDFGNRFQELKRHLDDEFEEWKRE